MGFPFWLRIKRSAFISTFFLKYYLGLVWNLATPKNLTYYWGFGRFLGMVIVVQIGSGVILAFYYLKFSWIRGWAIIRFTIIAAFFGYVLPWGQISFWGATVIINLLRVLPMGSTLVIWLWGGFYVSSFTCRFFFAIHFIVPFLILGLAVIHLFLLHITGSSVPGGVRFSGALKLKFGHFYFYKDIVNLSFFWVILLSMLLWPDWFVDPVNFIVSDLSRSPLHIQPEWYFLHLYAVLRSIPNKLGGLVGFVLALIVLLILVLCQANQRLSQYKFYNVFFWLFLYSNIVLLWLGIQGVEIPYVAIGQAITISYFGLIFILIWRDLATRSLHR